MPYKSSAGRGSGKLVQVFKSTDSGLGIGGGSVSVSIAPNINAVSIAGTASTNRFTSRTFYIDATVLQTGNPVSTKSVKVWTTGTLNTVTQTGIVTSVTTATPSPNWSSYLVTGGGYGSYSNPTYMFDGDEYTQAQSTTKNQNGDFSRFKWTLTGGLSIACKTFLVTGGASNVPNSNYGYTLYYSDGTSQSCTFNETVTVPVGKKVTGFESGTNFNGNGYYSWYIYVRTVFVDGYMLQNTDSLASINLENNNDLSRIQIGDTLTQKTTLATGIVLEKDTTNKILYFRAVTGSWQNGYVVDGPAQPTESKTLYLTINSSGNVTGFNTVDGGFYSQSTTLPVNVVFPSLMASGQTPDFELRPGTSLNATLKVFNSAGSEELTASPIYPS